MMTYLDSSVIARSYLKNEPGHAEAVAAMKGTAGSIRVTGTWTRIEVSSALVRSARHTDTDPLPLLMALDVDLMAADGQVLLIDVEQAEVEGLALALVREHGVRSMDAWHLACAAAIRAGVSDPTEPFGFATYDREQAAIAARMGFAPA